MNVVAPIAADVGGLPALIDRAAQALAGARTSAEVLEAREMAGFAYDAAKRAGRLAKSRQAHDDLVSTAYRLQADALEIESQAKRRLADEYDAAQEVGDAAKRGRPKNADWEKRLEDPTFFKAGDGRLAAEKIAADIVPPAQQSELRLTKDLVHEARLVRDAEQADPGIVRRTLDAKLERKEEPTRAAVREAVLAAAERGLKHGGRAPAPSRRNPLYEPPTAAMSAWNHVSGACRSLAEWATKENVRLAIAGRNETEVQHGIRERDDEAVRAAFTCLGSILEIIDAE